MKIQGVCQFFHQEGTIIFWTENRFDVSWPIYLVADRTWLTTGGQVDAAEGQALANRYGCRFFKNSSQSQEQVTALVMEMVEDCISREMKAPVVSRQVAVQEHYSIRSRTRALTKRVLDRFN